MEEKSWEIQSISNTANTKVISGRVGSESRAKVEVTHHPGAFKTNRHMADEMRMLSHYLETLFGSHFICFTGTKVRILTHKVMLVPVDAELEAFLQQYACLHLFSRFSIPPANSATSHGAVIKYIRATDTRGVTVCMCVCTHTHVRPTAPKPDTVTKQSQPYSHEQACPMMDGCVVV